MWEIKYGLECKGTYLLEDNLSEEPTYMGICRSHPFKRKLLAFHFLFSLLTGWKWWQLEQLPRTPRQKPDVKAQLPATWIAHLLLVM